MMPVIFTPANDAELNHLIAQTQQSLGKYFNLNISERRSEKLRDFVCESLGFTNGGYQQLKATWANKSFAVTPSAQEFEYRLSLLGSYSYYRRDALVSDILARAFEKFNDVARCLGSEHQSQSHDPLYSVRLAAGCETESLAKKALHAVWLYDTVVGYTTSKEDAALFGGVIMAACSDFSAYMGVDKPAGYAPQYLLLRMSGETSGLHIQFDQITVKSTFDAERKLLSQTLCVHNAKYGALEIEFNPKTRCYRFNDIEFDFMIAYSKSQTAGFACGMNDARTTCTRCEFDGSAISLYPLMADFDAADDEVVWQMTPETAELFIS